MPVTSITRGVGKWCLGHGVTSQAESLRCGHYVEAQYVKDVFGTRDGDVRASKGFARTLEPRCRACRSIRQWHDHGANARRRAMKWRPQHAERWVRDGRASSVEEVIWQMDIGGVTEDALTALVVNSIGDICPGLCAHEDNAVIVYHRIERVAQIHIDVKDPDQPFTIENIGILCSESCNMAKGRTPWATFIYQRKVMLSAWQQAIDRPDYRRGEQQAIPGV